MVRHTVPDIYSLCAVVKRSRSVAKRLNDGVGFLMKKNKVSVIWGEAEIAAQGRITVKASKSVIAAALTKRAGTRLFIRSRPFHHAGI